MGTRQERSVFSLSKTPTSPVMGPFPLFVLQWGQRSPKGDWSPEKISSVTCNHVYKYAVFDVKPSYNH